jgi:ADP-ribose pyrophosphatase YjhB (NUDIX family)
VFWDNPAPVVAAIIEHEGAVVLVRNKGWPEKMFGLVTGFLERGESPEAAILREVREELSLDGTVAGLVGVYPFEAMHQVILAYHVIATGMVALGEELEDFRRVDPDRLRPWGMGTGLAVRDWLERRSVTSP